MDKAEQKKYLR